MSFQIVCLQPIRAVTLLTRLPDARFNCRLRSAGPYPNLSSVKQEPSPTNYVLLEGQCAGSDVCPLSSVQAGSTVCIKQLAASPEMIDRLREMGFCEEQKIKLLSRQSSLICQVCNARLGISERLADAIMVEPVSPKPSRAGS